MSKRSKDKKKKRSTASAAKRRAEKHQTGFENTALSLPDDAPLFRLKNEKAIRIDIIPYVVGSGNPYADEGELHYERTFWVHRGIGVDQSSYICLRKTIEEKCPICEHRAKLTKDPDADEDLIKDLAPKERQLFNVIDVKDRDKGIQLWEISWFLFGKKLDARIKNQDEDDDYDKFAELDHGATLKCGIEEGYFGGQTFYGVETIDFKPRKEDYDEELLDDAYILDDLLKPLEYDELKTIFLQTGEDDDDDVVVDKSSKKKKKDKKGKKDKDTDDFDEDFDDDKIEVGDDVKFTDDDDEEVTGNVLSIKKGKAVVETDDDEVKVAVSDLTLAEKDETVQNFDDELTDLDADDDDDSFDAFEDEITERCEEASLDPDDFDTWKEAELAVRKKAAKKSSKKSSKKKKKSKK